MSENIVVYRANQELQADDLNNMQSWAQEGLDHVVLDAINGGKAYSGFTVTKASTTQVNVAAGRLYDGGAVYAREDVTALDLYNDLPVATKRYFAVVAWGQTVDEDIQPRNFLIDADTGEAEPQSVAMQSTRYCNINYVKGTESADPQYPNVEATTLLLGYVLCTPEGIESVVQSEENQVDNLALIAARTGVLEAWRAILAGMVDTLRTDLANLASQMLNYTPLSEYQKLVNIVSNHALRLGALEKSVELISGLFLFVGRDAFLDTSQSDTDGVLDAHTYAAQVNEGLRLPGGSVDTSGHLTLLNANDPLVTETADDMMLPTPSGSRVRYDCSFLQHPWIEHRLLAYATYHPSWTCHHLRPSRWRHRCGRHFMPCPPAQVWWHESQRDAVKHILSFVAESWEDVEWGEVELHHENDVRWPRHGSDRWKWFWRDWVHLPHWDKVYTDYTHSGNHMVQSFFNSQDGWLCGITLFLMKASYGELNVVVSGCDQEGSPDAENHTLRRLTIDAATLEDCAETPIYAGDVHAEEVIAVQGTRGSTWYKTVFKDIPVYVYPVRIPISPVFLRAGQHFSIHLHSTFDHYFAVTDRDDAYQVHQGHCWHYDGSRLRPWPSGPLSLRFKLHFATWGRWGDQSSPGGQLRYEVGLQPLLLAGGITAADVLAESIIPEACNVSYEVQEGGAWRPFAADADGPTFAGAPTQLPFRAVFTGTTDLMPGVSFANSQLTLTAAPADEFWHFSESQTCAESSCIKVVARLIGFVEANHELDCSVHYNGSTHKDFDTEVDKVEADGTRTRTFTHNVTACTSFQVELHGTSNHTGDEFVVSSVEWFAKAT